MQRNLLISTTLAAVAAWPMASFASSASENLTVTLTVNPIILLVVTDSDVTMTATDLSDATLDGRGLPVANGRAEFYVAANTGYDILLTPDETWGTPGNRKVKFTEAEDPTVYLAGELFLDTDITNDDRRQNDSDLVGWNRLAGLVLHTQPNRGVHRYGVGAIFDPTDWSGASNATPAGAPAEAVSIAPPGTYSSVVAVTVASR